MSVKFDQVNGLVSGKYGFPVSFDMICAQSRWENLFLPPSPSISDDPAIAKSSPRSSPTSSTSPISSDLSSSSHNREFTSGPNKTTNRDVQINAEFAAATPDPVFGEDGQSASKILAKLQKSAIEIGDVLFKSPDGMVLQPTLDEYKYIYSKGKQTNDIAELAPDYGDCNSL
ncbi:unnamed protein product [Protopolystoma xenopodis]|uniref:Uncharacterized protein n=1 Tax=Protopolystoma xenopodis TaxID=117903 RepID=A0A448XR59_9PLAT|nr:unnamed protein product [Protopolystoma xenopodis]